MVVERFDTFLEWLLPSPVDGSLGALVYFSLMLLGGIAFGIFIGYLVAAARHGLGEGFYRVATILAGAIPDFLKISPRRVMAVAWLAVKESVRARVIVAFVVFSVLLMYARWFLDVQSDDPAKLYMLFVINATTFLMLVLAVFISTFSLPADMKSRTIYTIVTKPVRASEIVIGRMLGFSAVATVIVVAMAAVGYLFVTRSLDHTHQLEATAEEIEAELADNGRWTGFTTRDKNHRHAITITSDGEVFDSESTQDHWHRVEKRGDKYVVSSPQDQLQARVPRYGELSYRDRDGGDGGGVSVGKEWSYRKYIQGRTLAAAIWTFKDIRAERFPYDELPLELTLSVFRTYKADMTVGVQGSIMLRNPSPNATFKQSVPITFTSKEFQVDRHFIPRKIQAVRASDESYAEADLFEDLCDENGNIEVWVRCEDNNQYFGAAQGDLYVLEAERPFAVNYVKGFFAIWMQTVLVICFGVMVSTRLNGAISMLATLCYIIIGTYRDSIVGVFKGMWQNNALLTSAFGQLRGQSQELLGGGPIESVIRILTQKNLTSDLDMNWLAEGFVRWVDLGLQVIMMAVTHFAPKFSDFNTANYLAEGYDINGHLVAAQATTCFTYLVVMAVVGYFFLKTREIAAT
ncbi:MAG: hypothetical protein KDB14_31345 [Planctomycetales bacterium]|nr:hypothetical protein [Planctomycetales bacterium]